MSLERFKKVKIKKKEKNKFLGPLITVVLVISLIIIVVFYINYYFFGGRVKQYVKKAENITLLFLGKDEGIGGERTDTIFLFVYNPSSHRVGIIAFPRDLIVNVETDIGTKSEKINGIYARYGLNTLIKSVERLSGIEVKFYAIMDLKSLVKIVDLVGGVEVYVTKPMHYLDKSAGLYINIPPGLIRCDGMKAMEFIRYRGDERGDIARIEREYEFLVNFAREVVIKKNLISNIKLLKILFKMVDTNLNFRDVINLIKTTSINAVESIDFMKIPGTFVQIENVKYIKPDVKEVRKRIKQFINNLSTVKETYHPSEIRVQVLNGTKKPGLARLVRDKLVRNGFNVVEFGNADRFNYEHTLILDRIGNMKKAAKVASILNCKRIYPKINRFILIDVTVIVGKDYKKLLKYR